MPRTCCFREIRGRAKRLLDDAAAKHGHGTTGHDTTTCLDADDQGNVIAATPSGWSAVQAGHTGIWLGSRLQSFNSWPGHVNCIEPGKRPRITLTPTLVFKDKRPMPIQRLTLRNAPVSLAHIAACSDRKTEKTRKKPRAGRGGAARC
jgi:hypothetical protein